MPIVFLSSHMEPEIVEKTEKITSNGYVVKSSSITVLDASIKMAFKLFDANLKIEENVKSEQPAGVPRLSELDIINELQTSEKQYCLLFESTIEGICLHELVYSDEGKAVDYRLLDVNPKFEEILKLRKADVEGRLATEVYKTEEAPYLEAYTRVAETSCAPSAVSSIISNPIRLRPAASRAKLQLKLAFQLGARDTQTLFSELMRLSTIVISFLTFFAFWGQTEIHSPQAIHFSAITDA